MKNAVIRFRLPDSLKEKIIQAAKKNGTTVSDFLRRELEIIVH